MIPLSGVRTSWLTAARNRAFATAAASAASRARSRCASAALRRVMSVVMQTTPAGSEGPVGRQAPRRHDHRDDVGAARTEAELDLGGRSLPPGGLEDAGVERLLALGEELPGRPTQERVGRPPQRPNEGRVRPLDASRPVDDEEAVAHAGDQGVDVLLVDELGPLAGEVADHLAEAARERVDLVPEPWLEAHGEVAFSDPAGGRVELPKGPGEARRAEDRQQERQQAHADGDGQDRVPQSIGRRERDRGLLDHDERPARQAHRPCVADEVRLALDRDHPEAAPTVAGEHLRPGAREQAAAPGRHRLDAGRGGDDEAVAPEEHPAGAPRDQGLLAAEALE